MRVKVQAPCPRNGRGQTPAQSGWSLRTAGEPRAEPSGPGSGPRPRPVRPARRGPPHAEAGRPRRARSPPTRSAGGTHRGGRGPDPWSPTPSRERARRERRLDVDAVGYLVRRVPFAIAFHSGSLPPRVSCRAGDCAMRRTHVHRAQARGRRSVMPIWSWVRASAVHHPRGRRAPAATSGTGARRHNERHAPFDHLRVLYAGRW